MPVIMRAPLTEAPTVPVTSDYKCFNLTKIPCVNLKCLATKPSRFLTGY